MLIRFSLLLVFLSSSFSYGQIVKFEPIREYHKTGRKVFDDVMSHSNNNTDFGPVEVNAHEHSHVASNQLTLKEHAYEEYEYIYVLDNYGFKFKRPTKSFSVLRVASKIPQEHRGEVFDTYMIQQSKKYFDNDPINILDEWNAYTIGVMAGIEAKETDFAIQDQGWRMLELGIYSLYLQKAVNQSDFNEFVKLETKRNYFVCSKINMSEHMKKNLTIFKQLNEKNK